MISFIISVIILAVMNKHGKFPHPVDKVVRLIFYIYIFVFLCFLFFFLFAFKQHKTNRLTDICLGDRLGVYTRGGVIFASWGVL